MLDAAERLLQASPSADFSMRALATEAGVGFATPFNHFGSKNAIMQALSSRVIKRMATRFREQRPQGDAVDRVLAMGRISVGVLLEKPDVSKSVVGSLGVAGPSPSAVLPQSEALWSLALGDLSTLSSDAPIALRAVLPQQLAFTFRGCVSFWIAGELTDEAMVTAFQTGALAILLGFVNPTRRAALMAQMSPLPIP
ncbi:AcrR family transcriptional regulator [Rhodoblastus sphagnicola]|uniref:TetR/AcrR family transcriptional regulator n=1 Tax=Rhodoblastus sphagnicola TaxID=333368 RepID=UPI00179DF698|nr:TetR/AcrR family transcriptional regulator [Rhodoblastus sphagnicola]MBB4200800.1 AcrR family transcriptional regulator [Rhodoblastus sphagnicola]